MEYPKIETLFVRDKETFKVDPTSIRLPEFGLIKEWLVTEKIDGTNIRITIRHGGVEFRGRTDKAQMPPFLFVRLEEMFPPERCGAAFDDDVCEVTLFGEGYGARIQKGGGNYREGVSFRLFDVAVDPHGEGDYWWLNWENVEDIARKLGIETVPVLGVYTLRDATGLVGSFSRVAAQDKGGPNVPSEGIVARTEPLLCDRHGRRLMWKLKGKDFSGGRL